MIKQVNQLIDASGSIRNCWQWLANFWSKSIPKDNSIAITFSNYPTVLKGEKVIHQDIQEHGGGGAQIVLAFVEFENQLANISVNQKLTAIFISDGADSMVTTLDRKMKQNLSGNLLNHRINFI
ncbi:unnamed protein product (macronuclear) [Paramecium tetraurelia]|uniref:VWFA domain-containing protein n=1 Tax=Paramecium tetraurelia TaxID=5888 RepID=A0BKC7_PARTE|nr:uncharacterized protein GSPATT00029625001 [Paramecium tetraurelia]CAK58994.1 unnamed protein product [Paramecium tetraurelia]|eukprot:XP_001426392.1 hypothetical protein (macronuclear) [Paramecium tetraurelia strain d4-2]